MVVDSHHHFWDPSRRDYPWMGEGLASIRRPFGPEELAPLLASTGIDRTVLVQTISSLDETREFLSTAASTDFIAGVVGWVDLTDPSVADTLQQLRAGPGGSTLVGIRHQVHDEPDPRWLLRPDVRRGIRAVGDAGLVYDLLVRTGELPAAVELASDSWERAMLPLADHENVACKLSGMVTEADWKRWTPHDLEPYVTRVFAWFGPERCMFGSDWPVSLLASDYARTFTTMKALVGENTEVFGGTATRVYGLG